MGAKAPMLCHSQTDKSHISNPEPGFAPSFGLVKRWSSSFAVVLADGWVTAE